MGWRQKAPGIVGAGVDCRIGPARAHLHRWSISNLGRRRNHSAWRHGRGGVIAKAGLREEQLDSLAVLFAANTNHVLLIAIDKDGI